MMTNFVKKLFCPRFLKELIFVGKYTALLQMILALGFCVWSLFGGPLGCLAYGEVLGEASLTTLTVTLCIRIFASFCRRVGIEI